MKRSRAEDILHTSIAKYLALAEPEGFFWTSIENRRNGRNEGGRWKERGCKAGVPDILTIYRGSVLFLEVKSLKGRLQPSQKERIPEINNAGAGVVIVKSVEDVFHALTRAGVPLRATPA